MKTPCILLSVVGQLLFAGVALAAEDHSQHQHGGARETQRDEPTESERAHVPPDPPQHVMGAMTEKQMIELMQMDDDAAFGMLRVDQLEWREADTQAWDVQAWYGRDHDKLWFKTEGERVEEEESGRAELLWDRIVSPWWSVQAGVRQDFGAGESRTWAAVGVHGLAPQFFEIEAALYVGEEGRTAARFSVEYDMLFTQRLILQPRLDLDAYGKDDVDNGIGSGLSHLEIGLRLRYEVRRELAPYAGVHWERKLGGTEDVARAAGEDASAVSVVAGVRAWF